MRRALKLPAVVVAALLPVLALAAPARASTQVGGPFLGLTGYYDYSDSGIRDVAAGTETHWWCGDLPGHTTDTILQEQYRLPDWSVAIPERQVLAEGPTGAWDSAYTCNPSVVEGSFVNPLGDGVTYTYAMYYVGTASGADNSIGVAFSLDGATWHKSPGPVIQFADTGHGYYGYAQPNATVIAGQVELLYEDSDAGSTTHWLATSPDGAHFAPATPVAAAGLPSPTPNWGGISYDPLDGRWYALFNHGLRPISTTGGVQERGDGGVTLYATADLAAGPWVELDTIDTVITGSESNFLAGLLRDPDGELSSAFLPSVKVDVSQSWPRPAYNASDAELGDSAAFNSWQIGWHTWTPGAPLRRLVRVLHAATGQRETTTGWYDATYYTPETANLGSLYEAPIGDATTPLFSCKLGYSDYLAVPDASCLGQYKLGLLGYMYAAPAAGRLPLYRCEVPQVGDYVDTDPACGGNKVMQLLGYSQS